MIDSKEIEKLVLEKIEGTSVFLVEVKVSTSNMINVFVDSPSGLGIDECISISRHIEEAYDRDVEDFSLEVSSPGIGQPLKVFNQYKKVLGRTVEVLFADGKKQEGVMTELNQDGFVLEYTVREKEEGAKRAKDVEKKQFVEFASIKTAIETLKV